MKYLLDANTYIQAKNQYYAMDICPAYWQWLDMQFANGLVGSINMIGRELKDGNDELAGNYNPGNRDNFLAKGDPWIIAKAKVLGATVVSHESFMVEGTKKVKVPNICAAFSVPCISTFALLRELKARFTL